MRQRSSVSTVLTTMLLFGTWACLYAAPPSAPQPQPKVRVMQRVFKLPIVARLLPDDEIVQVEQDVDVVEIVGEPTVQWTVDYAIETAEHIAVVEIGDAAGILVEDGEWIRTKLTGVARDVFKSSPDRRVSRGQPIEIQVSGGELKIGEVVVRTGELIRLPGQRRYLMFLSFNRDWGALGPTYTPLLIESGRLVSLLPGGASTDKMHGVRLSEIQTRVRQVPRLR